MKKLILWLRAHRIGLALAGVFIAGLALRLWGTSSVYQRIEDIPVAKQIFHVYQGAWSPDPLLFYPIFFNYIVGVLLKLISGFLSFLGVNQGPGLYEFTLDQVLLAGRVTSALMGALTILVVFKIGKRLFSETIGLAAAFFFAFSFVHVLYSHQIVLDVPMTLFYSLSLYFCALILREGRWPHYLAAAVFAGLATATKYNGAFVVLSILAAHVWKKRDTQKNILKILFDPKLLISALVTLLSFVAGHPYSLLWFPSFIKASATLTRLVHQTEWYLVLVKPKTLWGKIWESRYVQGLGNIFSAEGLVLFALIVLGVVWIFVRRKKESAFLSLSALFYFLGCLGFLGFSRLRDLSTLALFYAFFAAFGLLFLRELIGRGRAGRAAFAALACLALLVPGTRSMTKTAYLHDDDTTQLAERWIKRNIPFGSSLGREWFTADIPEPVYGYRVLTRPYLWWDLPPFEQFDFIESSSASSGFFSKYKEYYPDQYGVYERLNDEHELLKDFFFEPLEFKNAEVKIYSGKIPRRRRPRLVLPSIPPEQNPAREFEIADGSVFGKDINAFFLSADESLERIFLSRTKIPQIAVFIHSP
jgi:hypothetical protein